MHLSYLYIKDFAVLKNVGFTFEGAGDLIRFHPWRGAYLFKVTVSVCYLVGG